MSFKNYYEILGIEQGASQEEVREGYRKASMKYKSSTNEMNEFSEQMLREVNEAIEVLANPEKKKAYDQTLNILEGAVNVQPEVPVQPQGPARVTVSRADADLISELIKKHFEKEKALRERKEALLASQVARPVSYFTFVKVLFCAIIVGIAYYLHSPHKFEFDFGGTKKENFTYEYRTKDTTLIYAKPELKKNTRVLKGVGKGTGFNTISETTYFFKIAYINEQGRNQEGYIRKEDLEKVAEIPF